MIERSFILCRPKKTLTNMKAVSRGIPSCRCFSVQQSTMPQRSEGRVPTQFLFVCFDGVHEVSNPGCSRVLFEWHRVACRENEDVELHLSADVELHLSARPTLTTPRGSRFLGPLWVSDEFVSQATGSWLEKEDEAVWSDAQSPMCRAKVLSHQCPQAVG